MSKEAQDAWKDFQDHLIDTGAIIIDRVPPGLKNAFINGFIRGAHHAQTRPAQGVSYDIKNNLPLTMNGQQIESALELAEDVRKVQRAKRNAGVNLQAASAINTNRVTIDEEV